MKPEKGWSITVFQVEVKHRRFVSRKWLREDIAARLRADDDVKGVRVKVIQQLKEKQP